MDNINRFASSSILKIAMEVLGEGNHGTIKDIVDTLTASSEYEYIITDGGKPEGEGWEKSPYSKNPNSWRREKGKYHDSKGKSELRDELQGITYDDVPEDAKKIMGRLIDAEELDQYKLNNYTRDMMNDKSISKVISDNMDYDYLESDEADLVEDFGDSSYGQMAHARTELSNLACKIMNVPPDNYSIYKTWYVDDKTLENARKFILANQKAAYMAGLVDEDGYILAYRGTDGQVKDGKYQGANCESWAVNPSLAFSGNNFIKAKIPVSRVIGCSLGNHGLYPCDESEITVNTAGLDLEFSDLATGDYDELHEIKSKECAKVAEQIKENLLKLQNQKKERIQKKVQDSQSPEQKKLKDYLQKSQKDEVSAAKSSKTPSDILDILAESQIYEIRSNVAKNLSTSAKTLEKLSNDPDEIIRQIVAENQNTSGDVLRKLSQDEDDYVREEVSSNENTPPDVLEYLSKDKNFSVRLGVARNSNTPEGVLKKLGMDWDLSVRMGVAGNSNTPLETLGELCKDKVPQVREMVAKNKSTPESILDTLAEDESSIIRYHVAKKPNVLISTLKKLANDENSDVRYEAEKNIVEKMDLMEEKMNSNWNQDRWAVAKSPNATEDMLKKLSTDLAPEVRTAVARNPNTPDNVLETLAKDKDQSVSDAARKVLEGKNKPSVQELPEKAPESPKPSSDFPKKTPKKPEAPKPPKPSSELKQMADKGDDVAKLWLEERKKLRHDFCVENIGDEETYQQMKSYKKAIGEKRGYGRSPQQVKDDFIKNMNPSKYGSPEEFQAARKRIQDMPVGKFDKLLGIIFNKDEDDEEEETEKK